MKTALILFCSGLCMFIFNACMENTPEYQTTRGQAQAQSLNDTHGVECFTTCSAKQCFKQCKGASDVIMRILD